MPYVDNDDQPHDMLLVVGKIHIFPTSYTTFGTGLCQPWSKLHGPNQTHRWAVKTTKTTSPQIIVCTTKHKAYGVSLIHAPLSQSWSMPLGVRLSTLNRWRRPSALWWCFLELYSLRSFWSVIWELKTRNNMISMRLKLNMISAKGWDQVGLLLKILWRLMDMLVIGIIQKICPLDDVVLLWLAWSWWILLWCTCSVMLWCMWCICMTVGRAWWMAQMHALEYILW